MSMLMAAAALSLQSCVESKTFTPLGSLDLMVPTEGAFLNEGGTAELAISVVRGEGREDEEISLEVSSLPEGVTATVYPIAAGEVTSKIALRASGTSFRGATEMTVKAGARNVSPEVRAKLFVAGPRGSLDVSYGEGSKKTFPLSIGILFPLSSGTVLAGNSAGALTLVRLDAEGNVDQSFGTMGSLTPAFPGGQLAMGSYYVVEQSDKKLVVVTATNDTYTQAALVLCRFHADGRVDMSYGMSGCAKSTFAHRVYGAAITATDDVVVWNGNDSGTMLTRFLPNGSQGASSQFLADPPVTHVATTPVVQRDGKIVVPCYLYSSDTGTQRAFLRFTADLALDESFGRGGRMITPTTNLPLRALPDGTFVGVGSFDDAGGTYATVSRYDASWRLFPGFESPSLRFPTASFSWFVGSVSTADGTVGVGSRNDGAFAGYVLDSAKIDESYGIRGLSRITFLASGDAVRGVAPASPRALLVSISRQASGTTELFKVWQ